MTVYFVSELGDLLKFLKSGSQVTLIEKWVEERNR